LLNKNPYLPWQSLHLETLCVQLNPQIGSIELQLKAEGTRLENSGTTPLLPAESAAHSTSELMIKLSGERSPMVSCHLRTWVAEKLAWFYHCAELS